MKLVLAAVLALPLLAAAPVVPLVAGSVRDQLGAPVAGARIELLSGSRRVAQAVTAADGTFVAGGEGDRVEIRCDYCRGMIAPVRDGLVTAIVRRYDALERSGPTEHDITALAGERVESLLELEPFVIVDESTRTVPGTSVSDRNATPYGGLLVIDGAPAYDPNAGVTTFDTLPQGAARSIGVARTNDAMAYGNLAQGGAFFVTTAGGASAAGTSGEDTVVRAAVNGTTLDASATASNAGYGDHRARASLEDAFTTLGANGIVEASSGEAGRAPGTSNALRSSFSSLSSTFASRGPVDVHGSFIVDRGSYAYTAPGFPEDASWSDTGIEAGVRSRANVAPFANFAMRTSSGWYEALAAGAFSQTVSQARATAGVRVADRHLDGEIAAATDDVAYRGADSPMTGRATSGVASIRYWGENWRFEGSVDSGYTLQTLLGSYQSYGTGESPVEQGSTNEATLSFGDRSRVRASLTALRWSGAAGARTSSAGASLAWQIAPTLSLRTWMLDESSTLWPQAWVGSTWLTYETGAFRADAIWARSLFGHSPYGHLDGTISGRINDRLRWFVSTQAYERRRTTIAGVSIR